MKNVNNSNQFEDIEISYRKQYGKLFSALIFRFGSNYINQIEDAIQNTFYKSLKSWKLNKSPKNKENWLFIVARNDLINQIRRESKTVSTLPSISALNVEEELQEDLRLKTILLFSGAKNISTQAKVIFVLKNIFGLHIKEISESTLIQVDAIYKSINRAKKTFHSNAFKKLLKLEKVDKNSISIVEEILYAVFNIGFDSFNSKKGSIVNDDICLEALALAKLLFQEYEKKSTSNLIALFCLHIARISSKEMNKKLIAFQEQKDNWNAELIKLGFHYMKKPKSLNRYYIEAIITSRHMTTKKFDLNYWNQIAELYKLLLSITESPIVKVNLCYCLHQAERTNEAIEFLKQIENQLPENHLYFSLVKADILKKENAKESGEIINNLLNNVSQEIRKKHITENILTNL
ncbi:MAG: DUF6596 domain-containing protein [Melioribacteraceae bacterium]